MPSFRRFLSSAARTRASAPPTLRIECGIGDLFGLSVTQFSPRDVYRRPPPPDSAPFDYRSRLRARIGSSCVNLRARRHCDVQSVVRHFQCSGGRLHDTWSMWRNALFYRVFRVSRALRILSKPELSKSCQKPVGRLAGSGGTFVKRPLFGPRVPDNRIANSAMRTRVMCDERSQAPLAYSLESETSRCCVP
jgi:hypothetical protein